MASYSYDEEMEQYRKEERREYEAFKAWLAEQDAEKERARQIAERQRIEREQALSLCVNADMTDLAVENLASAAEKRKREASRTSSPDSVFDSGEITPSTSSIPVSPAAVSTSASRLVKKPREESRSVYADDRRASTGPPHRSRPSNIAPNTRLENERPGELRNFPNARPQEARRASRPDVSVASSRPHRSQETSRRSSVAAAATPTPPRQFTSDRVPPKWYQETKKAPMALKAIEKDIYHQDTLTRISSLKAVMKRCEEERNRQKLTAMFNDLRNKLHDLEFREVSGLLVKKAHMLDDGPGLPKLFDPRHSHGVEYPWDLRADAQQLYNRWALQVFSVDLLRGIVKANHKGKQDKRNADSIDRNFVGRQFATYYGHGDLINGQWWPSQLCTVRDGAHGAAQGGIFGEAGKGCYSIVLSGGTIYPDQDDGEEILYCGTESKDSTPTENTNRMLETVRTPLQRRQPVRVIRSWNLSAQKSAYRPVRGFRYDGLYNVLGFEILDPSKAVHRFHLVRCGGQDPIRYRGKEARPTPQEINEYDKLKLSDV